MSICEICGVEINLESDGWLEGETGDICLDCVEAAEADGGDDIG